MKRLAAVLVAGALLTGTTACAPKTFESCADDTIKELVAKHGNAYMREKNLEASRIINDTCRQYPHK